jgi:hypothetical protein
MRLSRLLTKHSANAANIQKSNSVNHFNLYATIWKVRIFDGHSIKMNQPTKQSLTIRIFEGTPANRNSGKKSATDQK